MDHVYMLWDKNEGYHFPVFRDEKSATFALNLKFNSYWIETGWAKVEKKKVISIDGIKLEGY